LASDSLRWALIGDSSDDPALTIRHSFDGHIPIRAELPFLSHTDTCTLSSGAIAEPHTLLVMDDVFQSYSRATSNQRD
jgi:hypothetical protein